jgi:Domain of unknown function (DUF4272)
VNVDEIDVELRTPEEVRVRILILSSIMRRLTLENASPDSEGDSLADAFDEREWLRDQHLASQLTVREAAFLDSPLGCVAPEVIMEVSWQGEALVALAWAISASDLPPVDTTSDPQTIMELVPRPWDAVKAWISDPAFVSESDAVWQRELAEIWHWRATTELLRREAPPADRLDYEAAIAEVVAEARTAGFWPALPGVDFPVRGRSIKEIPNTEVDQLVALTGQRLRALNWICGFGKSWDDVPLDV